MTDTTKHIKKEMFYLKRIKAFFDGDNRVLKKYGAMADEIIAMSPEMEELSDDELKGKTDEFRERLKNGETLDDLLIEAYAVVREGAKRVLGLHPYKVQIQGGIVLHNGDIAEMRTGEGKTLTATMPVYLNALTGDGVHVVTVNDYLSSRDADEMGELYEFLGLSVGLNTQGMQSPEKKEAYACDITYSTNNELGFDYLRDNMAPSNERRVQRGLHYAIVDEVDSILIDEARTPLIISGQSQASSGTYMRVDAFVKDLVLEEEYTIDIESQAISLTEAGMDKAEEVFHKANLYDVENQALLHHIDIALQANYIMLRDKDYVVDEGLIKIVDGFTGRIMEGRQYSNGLHQAIEAKEGVEIQKESKTLANITFQNFFRMYKKLSGMTGTAKTEEEEFTEIYNMNVIAIPTNRPIQRDDKDDLLFPSLNGKYQAIIKEIKERNSVGQPILVGTASVETSEYIGSLLAQEGIPHEVLNAKNHFREAEIILNAGQPYSVTIATNMAGRGTDIKLGPGVVEMGGLAVIGTERHESRRIDDQLRGRSGRQGDPGVSQFYLSLDDELLQRFGGDNLGRMKDVLGFLSTDEEEVPLRNKMLTKQVLAAQERVEGNNYDSRKNVLQYDDVMREQREVIYRDRLEVLTTDDTTTIIRGIQQQILFGVINNHVVEGNTKATDLEGLAEFCRKTFNLDVTVEDLEGKTIEELRYFLYGMMHEQYSEKLEMFPQPSSILSFERQIILNVVDQVWTDHIDYMDRLKEGISLKSYAQDDPLVTYQEEGMRAFEDMKWDIGVRVSQITMNARIRLVQQAS